MTRMYIYCEGETEKLFVNRILEPFLQTKNVYVYTILSGNGRTGKHGGISQYGQVKRELVRICREHPNEMVTTLIDYSPVMSVPFDYDTSGTVYDVVRSKERAIERDISLPNLVMNFELHEFEAYLYCCPEAFSNYGKKMPMIVRNMVKNAGGPEMINTDPSRLPSKRLNDIIPGYTGSKRIHTNRILGHLSLDMIRSQCIHFDDWLNRICSE